MGCFQYCRFVGLFVCLFVNTIILEPLRYRHEIFTVARYRGGSRGGGQGGCPPVKFLPLRYGPQKFQDKAVTKARTSSKMAAFGCTTAHGWWFNVTGVLQWCSSCSQDQNLKAKSSTLKTKAKAIGSEPNANAKPLSIRSEQKSRYVWQPDRIGRLNELNFDCLCLDLFIFNYI